MSNCDQAMTIHFDGRRAAIANLIRKPILTREDVAGLMRFGFGDHSLNREEAEALFALECAPNEKCPEWTAYFVDAITDYVVWQSRPTGVVNTPQAEWLLAQVDRARSVGALAALVNVLAEAHRVPMWLAAAARGRASAGWPGVREALEAARLEAAQAA